MENAALNCELRLREVSWRRRCIRGFDIKKQIAGFRKAVHIGRHSKGMLSPTGIDRGRMTTWNRSRFFPSIAILAQPLPDIVPKRPFEPLVKATRDALCSPWLRQCLRQFDDSLARDADVAKTAIGTSNTVAGFERPLSPNEIEDIARAFADEMRKKRKRGTRTSGDVVGIASAVEAAAPHAVRPPGKRGRKAKYRLLEEEMKRRAAAGTIRATWDEEKKALRAWTRRLPANQRPTPKTIYNRHGELRAMYDSLVVRRNVPFS
jgi:hypothetical protein